jgi:site-specific DNA-methyltransferase (adenine-specific)
VSGELIPRDLTPGAVPRGYAEQLLERITVLDDPRTLYDGSAYLAGLAQRWNGFPAEKNEVKSAQMFCEIRLGQLLGPSPGHWANQDRGAYAHHDLPKERVKDFRRFFGHFGELAEAVRGGKRSRRSLLLLVDQWEAERREEERVDAGLSAQPTIEELIIRRGDFREVLDVEPGSAALVLTDPPYPREYLALWDDLGSCAARWLPAGGSLVAYCGQSILPEVLPRLAAHLRYWWTIAMLHQYGTAMIPGKWVSSGWKPLVWYVSDHRAGRTMLADRIDGTGARKTVPTGDDGAWAQGVEELAPIISMLTAPGDLVVDPFAGSGSVGIAALRYGRRFIGAEVNG